MGVDNGGDSLAPGNVAENQKDQYRSFQSRMLSMVSSVAIMVGISHKQCLGLERCGQRKKLTVINHLPSSIHQTQIGTEIIG